jgi:hypothetical protein
LLFFYRQIDNASKLPELIDQVDNNGGSIVMFEQVYSLILVTINRTVFAHVPEHNSPRAVGIKHAAVSLILGPWSWIGPFDTLRALITNLAGGIDVSESLNGNELSPYASTKLVQSKMERKAKAIQYGFAFVLIAILGILIWKLVLPTFDSTLWSASHIVLTLIVIVVGVAIGVVSGRKD